MNARASRSCAQDKNTRSCPRTVSSPRTPSLAHLAILVLARIDTNVHKPWGLRHRKMRLRSKITSHRNAEQPKRRSAAGAKTRSYPTDEDALHATNESRRVIEHTMNSLAAARRGHNVYLVQGRPCALQHDSEQPKRICSRSKTQLLERERLTGFLQGSVSGSGTPLSN